MRNKPKCRTILIDGIRYYDDKPKTCRQCFFWKNRKAGCVLGKQNCYPGRNSEDRAGKEVRM